MGELEFRDRIRHNCTKEGKFIFTFIGGTSNNPLGSYLDRIKCKICDREWIEIRDPIRVVRKPDNFVEYDSDYEREKSGDSNAKE